MSKSESLPGPAGASIDRVVPSRAAPSVVTGRRRLGRTIMLSFAALVIAAFAIAVVLVVT